VHNSRLPQWGLTWLNQVKCFYQHLCLVANEVLRNRQLRQAAKRLATSVKRHHTADIDTKKRTNFNRWTTTYKPYCKRTKSEPTRIAVPHLLKTILRHPASGSFGFAPPASRPFSKAKRATSLPTLGDKLRYSPTKILDL